MGEIAKALHALTRGYGIFRPDLVDALLQGELSALRRRWSIQVGNGSDDEQLRNAIRSINGNLRILVDQLGPRPSRQKDRDDLTPGEREKQYRHAVRVSFNFPFSPNDPEHDNRIYGLLRKMNLSERRDWLADNARGGLRIAISTGQADLEDAIVKIEQKLLEVSQGSQENVPTAELVTPQPTETPWLSPFYIPRPALHEEFAELVRQGAKRIAFVGLLGSGKSWLARELARTINGTEVPRIRVIAGTPNPRDLQAVYRRLGANLPPTITTEPNEYLTALLADNLLSVVILDDLFSLDELRDVNLDDFQGIVIATARVEGLAPSSFEVIHVRAMESGEVDQLVKKRLPDVRLDTYQERTTYGGDRLPLITEYLCALGKRQGVSQDHLFSLLLTRVSYNRIFSDARNDRGQSYMDGLREVCEIIRSVDPLASDLLAFLAWTQHVDRQWGVDQEVDINRLLMILQLDHTDVSEAHIWQALYTLRRFSLLEAKPKEFDTFSYQFENFSLYRLLIVVLADERAHVAEQYLHAVTNDFYFNYLSSDELFPAFFTYRGKLIYRFMDSALSMWAPFVLPHDGGRTLPGLSDDVRVKMKEVFSLFVDPSRTSQMDRFVEFIEHADDETLVIHLRNSGILKPWSA